MLRAFRDQINRDKPAGVPDAFIGWPRGRSIAGPYTPFVWFEQDPIDRSEEREDHSGLIVVTGVIVKADQGVVDQSELEQAIVTYYAIRASLLDAMHDQDSDFNAGWPGIADSSSDGSGVTPSDADGFDAEMSIGERWRVVGSDPVTPA